jgi:hypothetical protein
MRILSTTSSGITSDCIDEHRVALEAEEAEAEEAAGASTAAQATARAASDFCFCSSSTNSF